MSFLMEAQDFNWDLGPSLAGFLSESQRCLSEAERRTLESLLSDANGASTSQKQSVLNILSLCILRPCLTMPMMAWFRPLILDLVGRWKSLVAASNCPCHHDSSSMDCQSSDKVETQQRMEQMAFAFGKMLRIAPQIEPYVPCESLFARSLLTLST